MKGFTKESNFNESKTADSDKRILDNLGGAGISSDISLFSNNLRNTSVIPAKDYIFVNNRFVITNVYMLPYANNTIVTYNDVEYIVKNSNLTDSFQLYFTDNLSTVFVPTAPYKDIFRSDSVVFENIVNLNPERLPTKVITNTNIAVGGQLDIYNQFPINENIESIVQSTELLEYKKSSAVLTDRENTVRATFTVNGTVAITNTDSAGNPISGAFDVGTGPGMFLSDGVNKIRAFSDSSQPWIKVTGGLSTEASNITIKNLVMSNPSITGIAITTITQETINTSLKNVYSSIPVIIDNETYYLLCRRVI